MMNNNQLKKGFLNPPNEYRPVPFWSWNDTLEQEELDRQVKGFKEQGMGGFMMHTREGLETPYLGEEFMERIKSTVETAKQEGMKAWLYDEDRYSSGMGGGKVVQQGGEEVKAKALSLTVEQSLEIDESVLAVYRATIEGDYLTKYSQLKLENSFEQLSEDVYLVFRRKIAEPNEWCHNETYTDNLNKRTVELFIESTYEVYKEAVGHEFGRTIGGVFTDEPTLNGYSEKLEERQSWIPWTDDLPDYFYENNGYDFWRDLPFLFFLGARTNKMRHDYWKTMTLLFSESYTKQISDWCSANGLPFTGHFHSEGHLAGSVMTTGAIMPHYRYLDIPGIDTLCEQIDENLTIKQVSSVAHQYGRPRVITETYGVTGWDFTFEGRKWLGDWQYVLGVNLLTHHLALYSLKGCRKRDYPPSFNYNTNWWNYNHVMDDYYARLGGVLSQGEVVRNVLVIHPVSTVWSMLGVDVVGEWANTASQTNKLDDYNQQFNDFINLLLAEHFDFDLGDEIILQETGHVVDNELAVNLAFYKVVVLPPVQTLLKSTVTLLCNFMDAGGQVIAVQSLPTMIEGEESIIQLAKMIEHPNFIKEYDVSDVPQTLSKYISREVSIKNKYMQEATEFLYMYRESNESRIVFIVNKDRNDSHEVEIVLKGIGKVEEWDVLTGEIIEKEVEVRSESVYFKERFEPVDSKLYVINTSEPPLVSCSSRAKTRSTELIKALGPVSSFSRTALNVLPLDTCQYRIQSSKWSDKLAVWEAQRDIRKELGMRQVFANGGLQRHLWIHDGHKCDGTNVTFQFSFYVEELPEDDVYLVVEQAEQFQVKLNGQDQKTKVDGWFLDRCMGKIKLSEIKMGNNKIELSCAYMQSMEIEDCFIIGHFAVNSERKICKEPEEIQFGDWGLQGYPHYCGSIVYHFNFDYEFADLQNKKILLELGEYDAVTIDIKVNEVNAGHIPSKAQKNLDITKYIISGSNKVNIEVVGSPRNMLGPLHQANTDDEWMDWWSFRPTGKKYTPEYVTVPYGLMGQIHLYAVSNK